MARTSRKKAAKRNGPTLRGRMAGIRNELSGLRVANANGDLFQSTIKQLVALAGEIAEAADKVLTAGEAIQKSADTIAARTKDRTTKTHVNRIMKNTGDVFEACSFQDIAGQRIGKITRTVGAIEDGFHCLATLAGGQGINKGVKAGRKKAIDRIDGGIALEGPQINGPVVSQSDIDTLLD